MVRGTIKWWDNRKGLGALVSPDAPADVFAHLSSIEQGGDIPELHGGIPVEFECVRAPQDSFEYVAERWRLLQ